MKGYRIPALLACLLSVLLVGCGSKVVIGIPYNRPAQYHVPRKIKKLAIVEFGAASRKDKRWGEVAADKLKSVLDDYNKKFHRYELVDRTHFSGLLDERDRQLLIADTDTAVKFGKVAKADAMIYGSVKVNVEDTTGTRRALTMSGRMETKTHKIRRCYATVTFTMDDIQTHKTIVTETFSEEYNSDKDKKKGSPISRILGSSGDTVAPTVEVYGQLIDRCVKRFVAKISPHEEIAEVELEGGGKDVGTGNKLAKVGDYAEAIALYERALGDKFDNHAAAFNAGVCCEAMKKLKKAEAYYNRAIKVKPKQKYIDARRRVRNELNSAG